MESINSGGAYTQMIQCFHFTYIASFRACKDWLPDTHLELKKGHAFHIVSVYRQLHSTCDKVETACTLHHCDIHFHKSIVTIVQQMLHRKLAIIIQRSRQMTPGQQFMYVVLVTLRKHTWTKNYVINYNMTGPILKSMHTLLPTQKGKIHISRI